MGMARVVGVPMGIGVLVRLVVVMVAVPVLAVSVLVVVVVAGVTVRVSGLRLQQPELGRGDSRTQHALRRDRPVIDGEAAERGLERVEGQAQVQQRAEHHVARGAGETIEVQRLAQRLPFSRKLK